MTPDLARLRKLLAEATEKRSDYYSHRTPCPCSGCQGLCDIYAAVPALLDELEQLRADASRLRNHNCALQAALRFLQWESMIYGPDDEPEPGCLFCGRPKCDRESGHADGCALVALLKETP